MARNTAIWWLLGAGAAVAYLTTERRQVSSAASAVSSAVQSGVETVQAAVSGWKSVNLAPQWVPVINAAESQYGIPADLLARMAYQESRYRQDVIDGTTASPAGALGILQLMPRYFTTVQRPVPFTTQDTGDQINEAAGELSRLYSHFQDWGLAVAAYNDGQANIDAYVAGSRQLPSETVNYVSDVLADVPIPSATIPA